MSIPGKSHLQIGLDHLIDPESNPFLCPPLRYYLVIEMVAEVIFSMNIRCCIICNINVSWIKKWK